MNQPTSNESSDPPVGARGMTQAQRIAVWAVAIFALGATVVMTVDVLYRGVPGTRNTVDQANAAGKQPLLDPTPGFELTSAFGKPVSNKDLRGKIVIYNFIFTRCTLICPMMNFRMMEVQERLLKLDDPDKIRHQVKIISVSLDGGYDTPAVLKAYAYDKDRLIEADPELWWFLTGPQEKVWPMAEQGFKLQVTADPGGAVGEQISHSSRFVLVDRQGRIYNYYHSDDAAELDALVADASRLLEK
ncbi:SCO family protein [Poriferisphaera sp. WC338]|uniref:SCO family protein n=1 Tax=Poriferisphaera sp. WC338 TaxID=3425129 RepID=UPI003D81B4B8